MTNLDPRTRTRTQLAIELHVTVDQLNRAIRAGTIPSPDIVVNREAIYSGEGVERVHAIVAELAVRIPVRQGGGGAWPP